MTDDEIMLTVAMDHVEQVRGFAAEVRDEVEAGDRDAGDEKVARALESCARMLAALASKHRTGKT